MDKKVKNHTVFGAKKEKKVKDQNNSNLIPIPKGAKKERKRIGQGPGSGMGKTSTRGQKGQKARSSGLRRGFEGGQMPLHRRIPKRGFTNVFHVTFQPVNLFEIQKNGLTGEITPEVLFSKKLIKSKDEPIKILAFGEIKSVITITADKFSKSAEEKIKKAGGTIKVR